MHSVDAGNQYLSVKVARVVALEDAVGDVVPGQDLAGLPDKLLAVGNECNLAALGDCLLNDAGGSKGLAAAGWQVQCYALQAPSQRSAGFVFSVLLIGAQVKTHCRHPVLHLPDLCRLGFRCIQLTDWGKDQHHGSVT